jgi:hypothetical protein
MKNKITSLLAAFTVCIVLAGTAIGQSRFSVSAAVTPLLHNLDLTVKGDGSQKGSASYQGAMAGLTAYYALSTKWAVSVGVFYGRTSGDFKFSPDYSNVTTDTYRSFHLPVLLNYASSTHRLSPYFSGGLLVNYNNYVKRINPGFIYEGTQKIDDPNATVAYAMLGLGARYRLTEQTSLILQPTGAYRLGRPSDIYTRFNDYYLGLQAQIKVSF